MDLTLFINQINQLLQSADERTYLTGVCDLLRLHTRASVKLLKQEFLYDDCINGEHKLILGILKLNRNISPFDETETIAAKIVLSLCTVLLKNKEGQTTADKKRRMESVRAVINTLSFSELDAAVHVIRALDGENEGLLVAGHIADKLGFTRSVVTASLRKLEGAGLIETRSLGMKGTYVKVRDVLLVEELSKL